MDSETGLYYLQSRYYDPQICRFINTDTTDILEAKGDLYNKNLFAYCDNNPVARVDYGGEFWDTVLDVISLAIRVSEVINNPSSGTAWVGLAADAVCTVVPGLTGGGIAVKAATKADDAVDIVKAVGKTDDIVDTAKTVKKGWKVGDDVSSLTRAGNPPSWSTVRQRYWKNEAFYNPSKYPNDLNRMKKRRAPIGNDGFPMELHHPFGRKGANFYIFEPLTQYIHRLFHYGRY